MFEILSICKGGGYHYCRTSPPHPKRNSNNLYPLHRVLMENKIGRLLESHEHVHHKDEDKNNNHIDNLEIKTAKEHGAHHAEARRVEPMKLNCGNCGAEFTMRPHHVRRKLKTNKSGQIFCSHSCSAKYHFSRNGEVAQR